jgi:hypothetical protein
MRLISGNWIRVSLLLSLIVAFLLVLGCWKTLLILEIGAPELRLSVHQDDVIVCTYINSIYDVPVSEKLRIEDGHFRLFHVTTQSDAVLAFMGLERKDEPNADLEFKEFIVNAASLGHHVLRVHDRDIPLRSHSDQEGRIHVKLLKAPLLTHLTRSIWR